MRNRRTSWIVFGSSLFEGGSWNGNHATGSRRNRHSQEALGRFAAVMFADLLSFSHNSWSLQDCVAVMQVVVVSAAQMASTAEDGTDEYRDAAIWIQSGPTTMQGFIDYSNTPGSHHGDTYTHNSVTEKTRRTGSAVEAANAAKKGTVRAKFCSCHCIRQSTKNPRRQRNAC